MDIEVGVSYITRSGAVANYVTHVENDLIRFFCPDHDRTFEVDSLGNYKHDGVSTRQECPLDLIEHPT